MKKMIALLALIVLTMSSTAYAQTATDFDGHHNETAIRYLYDNGIVEGYPDGTFKPDNQLVRAELMKILVLGAGHNPNANEYNSCFPDVQDEWFAPYVCYAKSQGWVQGYEDGTFKPENDVNKVEAIKMLLEIFDVELITATTDPYEDTAATTWYGPYVSTAKEIGLLEETGPFYHPEIYIRREQVSENIYRLLTYESDTLSEDFETAFSTCESGYDETIITLIGRMKYELTGMKDGLCGFTVTVVESAEETFLPTGTDMTCHFENTKTFAEMQAETNVADACEGPLTNYN